MNTATLSPIATRFAWKEYRTLRAIWLSIVALGVLVQSLTALLAIPGTNMPSLMLAAVLVAGILYAIGATSVLYSVEYEDETHAFLSNLPVRWLPMFAAKLAVAATSAAALVLVLSLVGWLIAGRQWPPTNDARDLLGSLGFGVIEALAWGTLFSLLVKRPLVAAMLTIFFGVIVVQLIVSSRSTGNLARRTQKLTRRRCQFGC